MKTMKDKQNELIHQILALFPKDWNPHAEENEESDEMMMLKIGAELARAKEIQNDWFKTINENK